MAHVGQKVGLDARGVFGHFLGLADGLHGGPLGGDVLDDRDGALAAVSRVDGTGRHAGPEGRAILAHQQLLAHIGVAPPDRLVALAADQFIGGLVRIPHARGFAELLAVVVTQQLIHAAIAASDGAVLHQHHACACRFENGLLLLVGQA